MKTYPLFRTVINLCWLGLFILIVFISLALSDQLITKKTAATDASEIATEVTTNTNLKLTDLEKRGKQLFKVNCASCHAKDMKTDLIGPALGGVEVRWEAYPKEDLYNWIKNAGRLIDAGHPRAVALKAKWKTDMTPFTTLKTEDIDAILAYINH